MTYPDFENDLLRCSRILVPAGDADLIFVARSPERIFDFLSGLLFETSWFERFELHALSGGKKSSRGIRELSKRCAMTYGIWDCLEAIVKMVRPSVEVKFQFAR